MTLDPILIIGAGVSGLAFAQGLSKHGIAFEVYERDASITVRTQGYRFRVPDHGICALKQNITSEMFEEFHRSCCSDESIGNAASSPLDPQTAESAHIPQSLFASLPKQASQRRRPEGSNVDRTSLRSFLMEGIEEHIHLGKAFKSYEETDERVTVRFTDGTEVTGIALVGADGVWSRVRHQLNPSFRLADTEGRTVFGRTSITKELLTDLLPSCTKGPSMLLGRDRKFLIDPMIFDKESRYAPADYVYWVIFARSDEATLNGDPKSLSPDETMALAQKLTSDWHPSLRCLIDNATKEQVALFPIFTALPTVQPQQNSKSRVTLLGDAYHPMSPTMASGATTALRDTAVLVEQILQNDIASITSSLRMYEREACTYANEAITNSAMGGRIFFGMRDLGELPLV